MISKYDIYMNKMVWMLCWGRDSLTINTLTLYLLYSVGTRKDKKTISIRVNNNQNNELSLLMIKY